MNKAAEQSPEMIYHPSEGELQLTLRAVVAGTLLGGVVAAMNVYIGLRIGWTFGGSLIAAILSYSLFTLARPRNKFTPLETNIAQTAGSASGSMTSTAGMVAAIPAMGMLGHEFDWFSLTVWTAAVAWLGVFMAVPLRRQMVLVEKLRFPTGTATANTIVAMFADGADALRKARALVWWAVGAGLYTLLQYFFHELETPPLHTMEGVVGSAFAGAAAYGFTFYLSPVMLGAGILIGMRVAVSLAIGAVLAWAVVAPMVESQGWVTGKTMSYASGARGWVLWVGVAIMVADAMTSLGLSWRTIVNTFRTTSTGPEASDTSGEADRIPNTWWIGGLFLASAFTVLAAWQVFDIPPLMSVLAIALSTILAAIAVRSTGETDINPIGGMGKVTQLVYGGIAPGQMGTNLMAAGITGAGASQAADMMQDLKTGYLLGASPRKQLMAQLIGIAGGIFIVVPIYLMYAGQYDIGGLDPNATKSLPAPAAHAWKAMAELLSKGFDAMPTMAVYGVLVGLLFGMAMPILAKLMPEKKHFIPSGLAVGIAFIVPAFYSLAMFFGAVIFSIWKKRAPRAAEMLAFAIASGLLVGEGLMGLIKVGLTIFGVPENQGFSW